MPENDRRPPQQPQKQPLSIAPDAGHIPMSEEMDSARWTLPPIVPVLIALVAVAIVIAIVAFANRQTPSTGALTKVIAAENADSVLVAVHLNLNNAKNDYLWIKSITGELTDKDGKKYTDEAAPAVDLDRYIQAAPELGEGRIAPLKTEIKVPAHKSQAGMTIFVFPVNKAAFDARKSFAVRLDFYDQSTMVLKQ